MINSKQCKMHREICVIEVVLKKCFVKSAAHTHSSAECSTNQPNEFGIKAQKFVHSTKLLGPRQRQHYRAHCACMHILIIIIKLYTKHINRIYISSIDGYTAHFSAARYSVRSHTSTQTDRQTNINAFLFDAVCSVVFMDVYYFNCFDLNTMCTKESFKVRLGRRDRNKKYSFLCISKRCS